MFFLSGYWRHFVLRSMFSLAPSVRGVALVFCIVFAPSILGKSQNPLLEAGQEREVRVWAIQSSKTYHCPGSRWYGKTPDGKYMGECQAIREGYHPAFGRGCGSTCTGKVHI